MQFSDRRIELLFKMRVWMVIPEVDTGKDRKKNGHVTGNMYRKKFELERHSHGQLNTARPSPSSRARPCIGPWG